jgi:hypothetical protein
LFQIEGKRANETHLIRQDIAPLPVLRSLCFRSVGCGPSAPWLLTVASLRRYKPNSSRTQPGHTQAPSPHTAGHTSGQCEPAESAKMIQTPNWAHWGTGIGLCHSEWNLIHILFTISQNDNYTHRANIASSQPAGPPSDAQPSPTQCPL